MKRCIELPNGPKDHRHMITRYLLASFSILLLLSLVPSIPKASESTASPRLVSAVDVREGPGSFFPRVVRFQKNARITIVEESEGWLKVEGEGYSGWVPSLAVEQQEEAERDPFSSMRDRFATAFDDDAQDTEPYVSEAQIVAAVKGFIDNHIAASAGDMVDYSDDFFYRYDPQAYLRFRESRITNREWSRAKRSNRISSSDIPTPQPEMEMVGWAAGNKIAQVGLYNNPRLREYLNHVAMLVAESSHRPDIAVNVIILDTDDITGYAVPGGLIFVSLGAIRIMRTEAEFAAFIGHEISHLTFQHGHTELKKRETRLRADDATQRMEQMIDRAGLTDDRYRQVAQELQQLADDLFEYLVSDRLHEYEEEADLYGMIYANRAGYRGEALYNVLERISLIHREPELEFKSAWFGDTMVMRLNALRNQLSPRSIRQGHHHGEHWEAHTGYLR